jgi:GNAT superfamily N-acetyltransferase
MMLAADYRIRLMQPTDYAAISEICRVVYPHDIPYTTDELAEHHAVFPQGQFVVEHVPTGQPVGVHFTLRIRMADYHVDDPWDVLTAKGTFGDHNPEGPTLYGADVFVSPQHQHHGLAHALTDATRGLVVSENLWRMVGGSRLPGYGKVQEKLPAQEYIRLVRERHLVDPVLTAHLHDGWSAVTAIRGYLPHDVESAGWAAVIQWINPACPPPADMRIDRMARRQE